MDAATGFIGGKNALPLGEELLGVLFDFAGRFFGFVEAFDAIVIIGNFALEVSEICGVV